MKLKFKPFGDDDDAFVPKAKLIYIPTTAVTTILENTEFTVTYELSRGTFAERVSLSDFMWGDWGPVDAARGPDCDPLTTDDNAADLALTTPLNFCPLPAEVTVTIEDGGGQGDSSVTYKVKANANIENLASPSDVDEDSNPATPNTRVAAGVTRKIVWAVPDLNVTGLLQPYPALRLPYGRDVTVKTEIRRTTSAGTGIMEALAMRNTCGSYMPANTPATTTVTCPVVEALALVKVEASDGSGGMISLNAEHGRAVLVKADGTPETVQRAHIARVTVGEAADGTFGMSARDENGVVIDSFSVHSPATWRLRFRRKACAPATPCTSTSTTTSRSTDARHSPSTVRWPRIRLHWRAKARP